MTCEQVGALRSGWWCADTAAPSPSLHRQAEESCPGLKTIVYTRNAVGDDEPEHPTSMGSLQVLSFSAVMGLGRSQPVPFAEPTPQHLGLIMFTSGSTGTPKGVMLKHSSIVAAVAGLEDYFCAGVSQRATSE